MDSFGSFGGDDAHTPNFDQTMPSTGKHRVALERGAADVADTAIRALEQLQGTRFFLWVHFYDAHFPYKSKQGHANNSRDAYLEETALVGLAKTDLAEGYPKTACDLLECAYEIEPRFDIDKLLQRALNEVGRQ